MTDIMAIIAALGTTILSGLLYSFVVFKKSTKKEGDEFDPAKVKRTAMISMVLGLCSAFIAYYFGWTIQQAEAWGTASGLFGYLVIIVDQVASYVASPKAKADKEKLAEELKEDAKGIVPIVQKVVEDGKPSTPPATPPTPSTPSTPPTPPPSI